MGIAPLSSTARVFIDGLDRSRLGRFAVDEKALYLLHLAELYKIRLNEITKDYDHDFESVLVRTRKESTRAETVLHDYVQPDDRTGVAEELSLWWKLSGDEVLTDRFVRGMNRMRSHERLSVIAENPVEMHDYFAAGVWDIPLITRCIADGIDADMAVSL